MTGASSTSPNFTKSNVTMQLEVVCCLKFVLCVTLRSCVLSARAGHQSVCWCLWSLSDSDGFRQTGRCRLGRHPEPSRQACAKAIAEWVGRSLPPFGRKGIRNSVSSASNQWRDGSQLRAKAQRLLSAQWWISEAAAVQPELSPRRGGAEDGL